MNQIIQIVPSLPPIVNGVGDYALKLAQQLYQDFQIQTFFLVADHKWQRGNRNQHFPSVKVKFHTREALFELLTRCATNNTVVLLHYVGYGYAKRGCPRWLIDGLAQWKLRNPNLCLVTMFHEIAASGPFWSSAFWTSSLQKSLAQRLVKISNRVLTSKKLYAEILQHYGQGRFSEIPNLPVFSTVGEPLDLPELSTRQRHLVIFGGRSRRAKVYQSSFDQLHQICQCLDIHQIFDVGPKLDSVPPHISDVPITATGSLPSDEVSTILSSAIAGFFNYHPAFLGKSTIFAAYCAHRMLPVSAQMTSHIEDGLHPGKHYILPDQYSTGAKSETLLQSIVDTAFAWYQTHNLLTQAKTYTALLSNL